MYTLEKKKNLRVKWPRIVQGSFVLPFPHFHPFCSFREHFTTTPVKNSTQSIVIYTEILILLSIKNKKTSYLNSHDFRGDGLELV